MYVLLFWLSLLLHWFLSVLMPVSWSLGYCSFETKKWESNHYFLKTFLFFLNHSLFPLLLGLQVHVCKTAWHYPRGHQDCLPPPPAPIFFSQFFILDNFYGSDFEFTKSFLCHLQFTIKPIQWIFHFRYCSSHFYNFVILF